MVVHTSQSTDITTVHRRSAAASDEVLPKMSVSRNNRFEQNAPGSRAAHRASRVLVVDDNPDAAEMMAMLLELDGHDVRVAHDAESALTVADQFEPEVGLFDIGLPEIDGYELARRVRGDARLIHMYLVAITGWGQDEDRRRAHEAGFDTHLTKPAEPDAVRGVLAGAAAARMRRAADRPN